MYAYLYLSIYLLRADWATQAGDSVGVDLWDPGRVRILIYPKKPTPGFEALRN